MAEIEGLTISRRDELAAALEATAHADRAFASARDALALTQNAMAPAADRMAALTDASKALALAASQSTAAAGAVIRSEAAPRLLALDDAPEAELVNRWIGAKYLLQNGLTGDAESQASSAFFRAKGLPGLSGDVAYENWDQHPVAIAWVTAHRALMIDANAELPK